jgi:enolase
MTFRVQRVVLRSVFDSRGEVIPEVELQLKGGHIGVALASTPETGASDRQVSAVGMKGVRRIDDRLVSLVTPLKGSSFNTQGEFDAVLELLQDASLLTAGVSLALSLAFGRACARARGEPLYRYISALAGVQPEMPRLLVTIFSAARDLPCSRFPYRQIMIAPDLGTMGADLDAALTIRSAFECRMAAKAARLRGHDRQGPVIDQSDYEAILEELVAQIHSLGLASKVALALAGGSHWCATDAVTEGGWRKTNCEQRVAMHCRPIDVYNIRLVEHPFRSEDTAGWRSLTRRLAGRAWIMRDDLATYPSSCGGAIATGTVLNMDRIGGITAALKAARSAIAAGTVLCLSDGLGGTDPGLCDFAVATGARYLKIGCPRDGDRFPIYNQLLRLSEEIVSCRYRAAMPAGGDGQAGRKVVSVVP